MKKVLIVYFSVSGNTEKMAGYIAEGVRFGGNQAVTKEMGDIKSPADLAGYDGYIIGSPTYSQNVPGPVKEFLLQTEQADLKGKMGGAFGSFTHDVGYEHNNYAPAIILDTLEHKVKMAPFELGPFILKEDIVNTGEGMKACQDYGRVFGEKLAD